VEDDHRANLRRSARTPVSRRVDARVASRVDFFFEHHPITTTDAVESDWFPYDPVREVDAVP